MFKHCHFSFIFFCFQNTSVYQQGNRVIDIYGKTSEGATVCLHVYNFYDYIRVKKEPIIKAGFSAESFLDKINALCYAECKNKYVKRVLETRKEDFYFFQHDRVHDMFELQLCTGANRWLVFQMVKRVLEIECQFNFNQNEAIYDSKQKYIDKFLIDCKVDTCQWIYVDKTAWVPSGEKTTNCVIEGIVQDPYTAFKSISYLDTFTNEDKLNISRLRPGCDWNEMVDHVILAFDIECASLRDFDRMPHSAIDPIIQISVCVGRLFGENPIEETHVFCYRETGPVAGIEIHNYTTEIEMICGFLELVERIDPDAITGYNINNFDFPYIYNRLQLESKEDKMNVFSRSLKQKFSFVLFETVSDQKGARRSFKIKAPGRLIIDAMDCVIDQGHAFDSYTLENVAKELLGQHKEDMPYREIPKIFIEHDPIKLAQIASYCAKDAELSLLILRKIHAIEELVSKSIVVGLNREDLLRGGEQKKCFHIISKFIRDNGGQFAIPAHTFRYTNPGESSTATKKNFQGAIVIEPKVGYYCIEQDENVVTLDFTGLYPSVICRLNLCYTTLMKECDVRKQKDWIVDIDYIHVQSTNQYYVTKRHRESLLSGVIKYLGYHRSNAKREMSESEIGSMKYILANCRQLALKVVANSLFGMMGTTKHDSIIPCLSNAATITAVARDMLTDTIELIENTFTISNGYPFNAQVIYGDTDSCFIKMTNLACTEEAIRFGMKIASYVTEQLFESPVSLEFEKVFTRLLILKRKHYVGCMVEGIGHKPRLLQKGIISIRRNNPHFIRKVVSEVYNFILMKNDLEGAKELIRSTIRVLYRDGGKCTLLSKDNFVTTTTLSKDIEQYAKGRVLPAHVRIAKELQNQNLGRALGLGDRIPSIRCVPSDPKCRRLSDSIRHPSDAGSKYLVNIDEYFNQLKRPLCSYLKHFYNGEETEVERDLFQKVSKRNVAVNPSGSILKFVKRTGTSCHQFTNIDVSIPNVFIPA